MIRKTLVATALVLAGIGAQAQDVKFSGLVQVWYTQMLDNNLRNNSLSFMNSGKGYYNLRDEFKENSFSIRRTQIKLAGKVMDGVEYEVMVDPAINTSTTNPSILQDAAIILKPFSGFEFKAGQFKNHQTWEGMIASSEVIFANGSLLGRLFGEKRDRGFVASYTMGDPKDFSGKFSLGAFNGMTDAISGKGNDTNAQKDIVARVEFSVAKKHLFGAYTLQGVTDVTDKTGILIAPAAPGTGWPVRTEVYANKDKTSNLGAFYVFNSGPWHASAEYMEGLLGRRYPTLAAITPSVKREHMDQKFVSYYITGGYTFGKHSFLLRYDMMDYNRGSKWHTTYNPYTQTPVGIPTGNDYTPKYTEITAGYTYAWKPEKVKAANFKLNYISRSKNFLAPRAGQTGEQGGDSIIAALQVAF